MFSQEPRKAGWHPPYADTRPPTRFNSSVRPRNPTTRRVVSLKKTVLAGLTYFAIVLSTGFVLGVIRVPFLVPRIGERWAELAEMPIMAAVIFFAAGFILRRFPEICVPTRSLAVGVLALVLVIAAELGLAVVLQNQTLAEFLKSRDKVSGSVYLALLLVFAVMPRLRLSSHRRAAAHGKA